MTEAAAPDALPLWDLSDLYPAPDSTELSVDLDRMESDATAFEERCKGKLGDLDGEALGAAIADYERIDEAMSRAGSYAQLVYAGDQSDPQNGKFYQGVFERLNAISVKLLFFTLELNKLDDDRLETLLEAPALARSCCTKNTWSAAPPGCVYSTRPWRACASTSAASN
jgi:oligoendopeptidase F